MMASESIQHRQQETYFLNTDQSFASFHETESEQAALPVSDCGSSLQTSDPLVYLLSSPELSKLVPHNSSSRYKSASWTSTVSSSPTTSPLLSYATWTLASYIIQLAPLLQATQQPRVTCT